jgi:hypothetical protein
MRYIITENKLDNVVDKFITNKFNKLSTFKSKIFPVGLFYIDNHGNIIAEVIFPPHGRGVIIDWELWKEVSDFFGFETIKEQQESMSKWADQYFGFKDSLIDYRDFVETIEDL